MDLFTFTKPVLGGLYIAAILICILFSTLIGRAKIPASGYLTAFFIVKVLVIACEWLLWHTEQPTSFFWLSFLIILSFCLAPILYRFAGEIAQNASHAGNPHSKYFEAMVLVFAVMLLLPLLIASNVIIQLDYRPWFGTLIHITMSCCMVVFAIQVSVYWYKSWRIYRAELIRIKSFSSTLAHRSLFILKALLFLVFIHWSTGIIRTLNVWFWGNQQTVTTVALCIEYCVMLAGMFFLFHGSLSPVQQDDRSVQNEPQKPNKYAKVSLDETFRQRIVEKLNDTERVTELVCDNAISLTKFAAGLGEKSYYVSQVLNQDLHTNFYEFVTDHRIALAQKRLIETSEMNIFDIALSIGFNTKSTFNTAFKSRTGMTPSQFRTSSS